MQIMLIYELPWTQCIDLQLTQRTPLPISRSFHALTLVLYLPFPHANPHKLPTIGPFPHHLAEWNLRHTILLRKLPHNQVPHTPQGQIVLHSPSTTIMMTLPTYVYTYIQPQIIYWHNLPNKQMDLSKIFSQKTFFTGTSRDLRLSLSQTLVLLT